VVECGSVSGVQIPCIPVEKSTIAHILRRSPPVSGVREEPAVFAFRSPVHFFPPCISAPDGSALQGLRIPIGRHVSSALSNW